MKKLIGLFLITLISCSTISKSTYEQKYDVDFNTEQTKELGETLIKYHKGFFKKAIVLTKDIVVTDKKKTYTIQKGELFYHWSNTSPYEDYIPSYATFSNNMAFYDKELCYDVKRDKFVLGVKEGLAFNFIDLKTKPEFYYTLYPNKDADSRTLEFIYNGVSGNTAKFTYREYSNDYARPAFTQETQYDLNESKIIGFKGLRIEILKTTNIGITYKVLSGFNE